MEQHYQFRLERKISDAFKNYYISVGNHDIGHGSSNDFYTIFKDDLKIDWFLNFLYKKKIINDPNTKINNENK